MAYDEELAARWDSLLPKFKDRWPKVTDAEWQAVRGDVDQFVKKVAEHYPALSRTEILSELTPLLEKPKVEED